MSEYSRSTNALDGMDFCSKCGVRVNSEHTRCDCFVAEDEEETKQQQPEHRPWPSKFMRCCSNKYTNVIQKEEKLQTLVLIE